MKHKLHDLKKFSAFIALAILLLCPGLGWGQIISQYVETNSGSVPKGIEIWNNTSGTLDFATNNLVIQQGTNGGALSNLVTISTGTLAPAAVIVIGTSDIGTYLIGQGLTGVNFVTQAFTFNGDDALAVKYGGTTTDIFGTPGVDPGSEWSGSSVSTANQNIALLTGITTGASAWTDPSLRFSTISITPATLPAGLSGFGIAPVSGPIITVTGSFSPFTTTVGTPSTSQSVVVSGSNLTANIDISAVTGYEYSTTNADPWTSTLSLASSFNGNVYVRLTGASVGSPSGTISFTSTGATQVDKAVTGIVNPLTPVINVIGDFTAFSTTTGTPSASQSVTVSGSNLTTNIDVSAVAGFEYSTDNNDPWTSTLSLAPSFSGSVYVRLTGASLGSPNGTISFTSTGATQVDKAVSGTVTAPPPVLTVTGTFTAFSTPVGTPSLSQSVAVSGTNLTDVINVSAVTGYEYSTNDAAPWTSTLSLASNYNGNVYVRLTGVSNGSFPGTISFTSTAATQVDKTVSGTVSCAAAAFPFVENFNYATSSILTNNCWVAHSAGGTNPVTVQSGTITYSGYLSSGLGNQVSLTGSGEDVNRTFDAQTSGGIYASFLVNVSSASTGGDYFLHLGQTIIGTTIFRGRVFVKNDGLNNLAFGISQSSSTVNYSPFSFALNTTYLVVLKFSIIDGLANDVSSIYVNPVLNAPEPLSGWITNTDASSTDLTEVGSVALRQGGSSSAPSLIVDGIRISNNWEDIVGLIPPPATASTWNGNTNNDWNTASNWSDGVPGAVTDVTIPAGLTNYPTINASASCANLTLGNGSSLLDNGFLTINGTTTVERNITGGEWHLISSPVSTAVSGMFTGKYLQTHDEGTNAYTDITSTTELLTSVKGYALFDASSFTAPFVGALNTGAQSFSTTAASYSSPNGGWNLVGNPYPSSIDWDAVSGWTKTNVNDAIYIHVNASTWATYGSGVGVNEGGTRYIAPCQGFFVQATAAGTLAMTNAVRVHNATTFFKKSETVNNMVRLEVSGNTYKDEAVVRFLPEATAEFDGRYDAHKFYGDVPEAAQLYTLGSIPLAINSLPETNSVPVGIHVGVSGTYTIAATEINDLHYVTLEDTKTGIFTELARNSYTFNFTAGENEQRFVLHFSALGVDEKEVSNVNIYSYQQTVYINMNENVKGDIFIYNIAGLQVASKLSASGMNEIKLSNTGNYIVKVISKESSLVRKVFIN